MRTTLTLDDDVAAMLLAARQKQKASLKTVVNTALRQGLSQMLEPPSDTPRFETRTVKLGPCLIGSLDDVAEALARAEGEAFK